MRVPKGCATRMPGLPAGPADVIRDATPDDVPELVRIARSAAMEARGFSPAQRLDWASRMDSQFFEQIMAVATIRVAPGGYACRIADEVRLAYVDPAKQHNGTGRQLMADLERSARAGGLARLHLVTADNAVGFYERLGYVRTGTESATLGGEPVARIRMEKRL